MFIYLFIKPVPYPATAGSACNNAKKRDKEERTKKKLIRAEEKPTNQPNPGNCYNYEEEGRTKERNREWTPQPRYHTGFIHLLRKIQSQEQHNNTLNTCL